jgi:hypothetical protein
MIGKKYNRWLILKLYCRNKWREIIWKCKCDCGNIGYIKNSHLKNNFSKSCGCLQKEKITKHGMRYTKFYKHWEGMKSRCNNLNCKSYKNYGGRGIIYDSKWKKFENFKEDMYFKYVYYKKIYGENHLSLEREDVNGNYNFKNCIFIPLKDQAKNRRNSFKNLTFNLISV